MVKDLNLHFCGSRCFFLMMMLLVVHFSCLILNASGKWKSDDGSPTWNMKSVSLSTDVAFAAFSAFILNKISFGYVRNVLLFTAFHNKMGKMTCRNWITRCDLPSTRLPVQYDLSVIILRRLVVILLFVVLHAQSTVTLTENPQCTSHEISCGRVSCRKEMMGCQTARVQKANERLD